jgi:hypothetical protein
VLLVALVPSLGIAGAGIALCGAYIVMLMAMHMLTRRAFAVAFEWGRLAELATVMGGVAVAGNLLLPTHGAVGFLTRAAAFLAIPPALYLIGFVHPQELAGLRDVALRARRGLAREPA